jgi:hypothetical protein
MRNHRLNNVVSIWAGGGRWRTLPNRWVDRMIPAGENFWHCLDSCHLGKLAQRTWCTAFRR